MHITQSSDYHSITFSLSGRLDFNARHEVKPAIQEGYDAQKRIIILDLAGVTYIDSSGLGLIHRCITDAEDKNIQVTLSNPNQQVHDILELCNMTQYISSSPEEQTAQHQANVLTREAMSIID